MDALRRSRASLLAVCSILALTAGCAAADGSDDAARGDVVPWDRAGAHEGERVEVCGPLRGTGGTEGATFLNLGTDYPDPDRFTVVIWERVRQRWMVGSRVCVRGTVEAFEDIHEMQFDTLTEFERRSSVR